MRWTLKKKAIALFIVFETMLLLVFGGLFLLQEQAEEQSAREDMARQVISETQRMAFLIQAAGQAIGDYCKSQNPEYLDKCDEAGREIRKTCHWMTAQFEREPERRAIFARLSEACEVLVDDTHRVRETIRGLPLLDAVPVILEARESAQPRIKQLVADGLTVIEQEKTIIDEAPERNRRNRLAVQNLVIFGFFGTSLLALFGLFWFHRDICARLKRIEENNNRLTAEKPLLTRMRGCDEIVELDAIFHDTVLALREAQLIARTSASQNRDNQVREAGDDDYVAAAASDHEISINKEDGEETSEPGPTRLEIPKVKELI